MCYSEKDQRNGAILVAVIFMVFASPVVRAQVRQMFGIMGCQERLVLAGLAGLSAFFVMQYSARYVKCSCGDAKKQEEGGGGLFGNKESCGCKK